MYCGIHGKSEACFPSNYTHATYATQRTQLTQRTQRSLRELRWVETTLKPIYCRPIDVGCGAMLLLLLLLLLTRFCRANEPVSARHIHRHE